MSIVYWFDINRIMHIINENCSNGSYVNYTHILGKLFEKYPKIKRYHSKSFIKITDAGKFYFISYKNKIKSWIFTNIIAILALMVSIISLFF